MSEKDLNLEWNVDIEDLSSLELDEESLESLDAGDVLDTTTPLEVKEEGISSSDSLNFELPPQKSNIVDENMFLESWDNFHLKKNVLNDEDNLWKYLRRFFISSVLILLGILVIVVLYLFSTYIKESSNPNPDVKEQEYINKYKDKYKRLKGLMWSNNTYESPIVWSRNDAEKVN